jgi:hypothetical protein
MQDADSASNIKQIRANQLRQPTAAARARVNMTTKPFLISAPLMTADKLLLTVGNVPACMRRR